MCAHRNRNAVTYSALPKAFQGVWLLVLCGIVGSPAVHAQLTGPLSFAGTNAGAPIWGGNILFTDALAADIAGSGCRAVRINFRLDGNASWTAAHLAKYDQIIANARNHGLQILGILSNEVMPVGQDHWNDDADGDGMNQYVTDYAATAWLLVNRYKDDIKLWEVWNEPNCWSIDPGQNDPKYVGCSYMLPRVYANLLAESYKAIRSGGGASFFGTYGISLMTGGLLAHDIGGSNSNASDYMIQVYQRTSVWNAFQTLTGRKYAWDYFGYHYYVNQGEPVSTQKLASYLNTVRFYRNFYNDPSAFVISEIGWISNAGNGVTLQANNLRDAYNYFKTVADVKQVFWYQWNNGDPNGDWGLVYSIGNPKPAYFEFAIQCGTSPAPVANFTADPRAGVAPLVVQFTNQSTGGITTYAWNFGDGATSNSPSPEHTFAQAGSFTVSLTVTGTNGTDTETKTGYITVAPAPVEGDLDEDGDADLGDVALFQLCYGDGSLRSEDRVALTTWEKADTVAQLSVPIATNDLLAGRLAEKEAGGFHAATPGGDPGGLADLTDGILGGGFEAILQDFPGGDPPGAADPLNRALQIRYDFSPAVNLAEIRVFAANPSNPGNGRAFQNYDVAYSVAGDGGFSTLLNDVTTGAFGQDNNVDSSDPAYIGASLTRVTSSGGPLATQVDSLRFTFYPVSQTTGKFWDEASPGEAGDTDNQREAFESCILKEIDVLPYAGLLPPCDKADLNGDVVIDHVDAVLLGDVLAGPGAL